MKRKPMPEWILVKEIPEPDQWKPGAKILKADTGKEKARFGVVHAIGRHIQETDVKLGDVVYWGEYAGHEVIDWFGGETGLRALRFEDLIYIDVIEEGDEDPFAHIERIQKETMTGNIDL